MIHVALMALATTLTWSVGGAKREALVYPPSQTSAKAPVIFAFHGHGGTMGTAASARGSRAESGGMIYRVAAPRDWE